MTLRRRTKHLLAGLSVFIVLVLGVVVANLVRQPSKIANVEVTATLHPSASVASGGSGGATVQNACYLNFTVSPPLVPGLNCVKKELYKDDATNTPGTYKLSGNKLAPNYQLVPSEQYVYVINYENSGTAATGGSLTDVLAGGLTFVDASTGCSASGQTVTCSIASVGASSSGQKAIRFVVDEETNEELFKNTATITPQEGEPSYCSLTNPLAPSSSPSPSPSPSPKSSPSPSPSHSPGVSPSPTPSPSAGTANLSCIVKRAYEDDSRNSAGTYYLNNEIVDTTTLSDGQTIVYNIVAGNSGALAAPDVTVTDKLSSNLTFLDASSGCSYQSGSRTVSCEVGSLSGATQASKSIRVRIATSGSGAIANTAEVSSTNGQEDSCSITISAEGLVVQQPSPVPSELPAAGVFEVTAGTLSIGVILLLLGLLGLVLL